MHTYTATPQKPWILDSGASSHIIDIKENFVFLNMSTTHPSVKITNGTHYGIVQANSLLTLTNVLYVSRFRVSLMPINQLKNNCNITFSLLIVYLKTRRLKRGLVEGHERGGIYYMDNRVTSTGLVAGKFDPVLLWHWRLGHPSLQKIRSVIPVESSISSLGYESYELGKHHRAIFQSRVNNRSSSAFELVHFDVGGPSCVSFIKGFRYCILFVDDFSRMT